MKAPALLNAWSTVMPMLVKRFSKAMFLGRKIVATKSELLNAVTRPVLCSATSSHNRCCVWALVAVEEQSLQGDNENNGTR